MGGREGPAHKSPFPASKYKIFSLLPHGEDNSTPKGDTKQILTLPKVFKKKKKTHFNRMHDFPLKKL